MVKVGIVGGAGYTAGELIRILIMHPNVDISCIQSTSNAGESITKVHHDLLGETNLKFSGNLNYPLDVIFLCSGHGKSVQFLEKNNIPANIKIIDLSADFRLPDPSHNFIYGLPEKNAQQIKFANRIANPGCFATAIELAFLPLAAKNLLKNELHITAITGSTGAGQSHTATSHFSWKNNNVSVYKAFEHQHLAEIKQLLFEGKPNQPEINFIPVRGNFSRGILAMCYTESDLEIETIKNIYADFYSKSSFVFVSEANPDVKQVVNTNKCILYLEKHNNKLLIISAIDNLLKGASGQAVENMNIMFGFDRQAGLKLKPVAF